MTSSEIPSTLGPPIGGWIKWDEMLKPPQFLGVYILRTAGARTVGRVIGRSDLIYIGQGDLPKRMKAHLNFRSDLRDKAWLLSLIADSVGGLEIGFFRCGDARQAENDLLFTYFKDHLELPPANNKREKLTASQKGELTLMCLSPEQRDLVVKQLSKPATK